MPRFDRQEAKIYCSKYIINHRIKFLVKICNFLFGPFVFVLIKYINIYNAFLGIFLIILLLSGEFPIGKKKKKQQVWYVVRRSKQ